MDVKDMKVRATAVSHADGRFCVKLWYCDEKQRPILGTMQMEVPCISFKHARSVAEVMNEGWFNA